jgi:acyl-coenzyme A thioesterase PaaI-like protein
MSAVTQNILNRIPPKYRDTAMIRLFGIMKVPMLFWIRPSVVELSDKRCEIKIPLTRRTKNHLNSMYFGVLACGADCAGGLSAMKQIEQSGKKVSLAFKEFDAKFLKRPEGDTHFICDQGEEIQEFVQKVLASDERHNMPVKITATCPSKLGDEPVAEFTLILSLKKK